MPKAKVESAYFEGYLLWLINFLRLFSKNKSFYTIFTPYCVVVMHNTEYLYEAIGNFCKIMRSYLSKFMLTLYLLLAFTPQWLEEIAKIPALMVHYKTHLQENPSTTLLSFLSQHYGKGYANHSDHHDHSKLPGKAKHNDSCMHMQATGDSVLPHCIDFVVKHEWEEPCNSSLFAQDQILSSADLSGIWQPPRA